MYYEEIKDKIFEIIGTEDINEFVYYLKCHSDEIYNEVGNFKIVERTNDSEDIAMVVEFIDHNVFIKIKGYESSLSGERWHTIYEVFPQQKTITVYY